MRRPSGLSIVLVVAIVCACRLGARGEEGVRIVGVAFLDSSVTGKGARAQLPPGTTIYPAGSTVKGTDGCTTNRYQTDGLPVAVLDYSGRPTVASLTITEHLADGNLIERAPYHMDLDPGRRLQFLGPIFENGTYDLKVDYDFAGGAPKSVSSKFVLDRTCPPVS